VNRQVVIRMAQISVAALVVASVFQELRKPPHRRSWHGKVLFIPYDFRKPTWERLKDTYWNPYEKRVLTPMVFGLGWTVNLHALLENLGIISQTDSSEENFLYPNSSLKELLRPGRKAAS
jgi:hypothetical protein